MHKADFATNMEVRSSHNVLKGLDSSKFSEILYSNKTLHKFSIYQVKINFQYLNFVHKAYLTCCKIPPPPGIKVLNFSILFILHRNNQNHL